MITITNVSKSFGQKKVLKEVNLQLEEGKVYGIVGKNGAGKSTLFRCITGLEFFDGTITSRYQPLKNHLGYLETNPIFLSKITGWEYLKLLCVARGISEDDFEQQNIFDLPLDQYAETYSTGMKKKLSLLGILLQKNAVFILDEPFNGVDVHSNILISELIKKLKSAGKTILIASHIFSTLSENCDEIFLLKDGVIEKTVGQNDFEMLDLEMKDFIIGDSINRLVIG